ncbi:hypothetical protein KC19_6G067400 [Ceratodon purpureus]|uniref:Uncharacterized protein n=1 Tax=Ceratodon purpureus TaxID=3225 RepID=A0A8T0HEQ4_CERPU|nr:hypothetical protein KC19_6G067400 [Ceratodon purpureus]
MYHLFIANTQACILDSQLHLHQKIDSPQQKRERSGVRRRRGNVRIGLGHEMKGGEGIVRGGLGALGRRMRDDLEGVARGGAEGDRLWAECGGGE